MKKTSFLAAAVAVAALACVSTQAFAAPGTPGQFYGGASLGEARASVDGDHDNAFSGKVYGGYSINPMFAVEVGYAHLGRYKYNDPTGSASVKGESVFADVVGTFPVATNLSVLGRVGVANTRVKLKANVIGFGPVSDSNSSTKLKVGAGMQYDLSPTTAVRGEWERYTADVGGVDLKANAFTVGVNYRF